MFYIHRKHHKTAKSSAPSKWFQPVRLDILRAKTEKTMIFIIFLCFLVNSSTNLRFRLSFWKFVKLFFVTGGRCVTLRTRHWICDTFTIFLIALSKRNFDFRFFRCISVTFHENAMVFCMVWYKPVSKKCLIAWNIREIHRKNRKSKFRFDNAIRNMVKVSQIQCRVRSVTHRPPVTKKSFTNFSNFHENDSKMDRKTASGQGNHEKSSKWMVVALS